LKFSQFERKHFAKPNDFSHFHTCRPAQVRKLAFSLSAFTKTEPKVGFELLFSSLQSLKAGFYSLLKEFFSWKQQAQRAHHHVNLLTTPRLTWAALPPPPRKFE
jgi:hypothetical protein